MYDAKHILVKVLEKMRIIYTTQSASKDKDKMHMLTSTLCINTHQFELVSVDIMLELIDYALICLYLDLDSSDSLKLLLNAAINQIHCMQFYPQLK